MIGSNDWNDTATTTINDKKQYVSCKSCHNFILSTIAICDKCGAEQ